MPRNQDDDSAELSRMREQRSLLPSQSSGASSTKQSHFTGVNETVFAADLFKDGASPYQRSSFQSMQRGGAMVEYATATFSYAHVVVHPCTNTTMQSDVKYPGENLYNELLQQKDVKNIITDTEKQTIHIIPEVVSGSLQKKLGIGNVGHIRLTVVTQESNKTFETAYNNKNCQIFDPRDMGLSAQNTFDDTNCGRYVAAMTIQAAGLAKDGLPINRANLSVSPAVHRALHFNTKEDAQKGLENAYVKPLRKNPAPEEIISHNLAKIKCLKSEYESREASGREYHGTALFGGYKAATFFTKALGFSATEKLEAVEAIELAMRDAGSQKIDFSKLPPAARQGELGKCVDTIEKAQKAQPEKISYRRLEP